jgi:multidrug efflux pump subunit AcrA (membrane-fusion protein)
MTAYRSPYFLFVWRLLSNRAVLTTLFFVGGVLTALFGASQLLGQQESAPSAQTRSIRILDVAAVAVEHQDGCQRTRSYLGKVASQRSSRLGFEVAGMLDAIHVREGESVGTNQLLAELDTERLEAIRKEAEAQLLEAQAALKLAKATPSAPNRRKN